MPTVLSRQTITTATQQPKVEYRDVNGEWVSDSSLNVATGDFIVLDAEAQQLTKDTGMWHYAKVLPLDRLKPFTDKQTKLPLLQLTQ